MARKRIEIIYNSTDITYQQLKQIEESTVKSKRVPRELLLDDINIADSVFQPRYFDDGDKLDYYHIVDLISGIKSSKFGPLNPMLVVSLGDKFYLVDGHHRYAAYRSMGWLTDRPVPVEVFRGGLDAAVLECGVRNNKNKLPMTTRCKSEYAWNLVKLGIGSKKEQYEASGTSESSIGRMRAVFKKLGAAEAEGLYWIDVLRNDQQSSKGDDPKGYYDLKAHELAGSIKRYARVNLVKHHFILASALDMIVSLGVV